MPVIKPPTRLGVLTMLAVVAAAVAAALAVAVTLPAQRQATPPSPAVSRPSAAPGQAQQAVAQAQATAADVQKTRPSPTPPAAVRPLASESAASNATNPTPAMAPATPTPASPPRLSVPVLGVDEPVLTIPIVDGNWDISQLDTHIGWLSTTGRRPGDDLAMAFIGHFTVTAARRGALADLWRTHLGDEIIYESNGVDYIYTIESKSTVGPNDVARLYVPDGRRLLLITCTDWDYLHWKYSNRLIVQAKLVRRDATR